MAGSLQSSTFTPLPGDIIVFPPWLVHEVEPTPGPVPRRAMSFNVKGHWDDTALCQAAPIEALALPNLEGAQA